MEDEVDRGFLCTPPPMGEVTITDDKPYLRCDDLRASISAIRSLESGGLMTPEPCLLWLQC
ncbi:MULTISPECIES: hypothetical protein [unclassified Streptomyces]|uniref:hypothetical protein n=1 Tax=Streptomyces sp. NPDC127532 TaxID=3345399 RepID=UPI0036405CD0